MVSGFVTSLLLMLFWAPAASSSEGKETIKFGMSYGQILDRVNCKLELDNAASEKELKVYSCENFESADGTAHASFHFINGQLQRISLLVGASLAEQASQREILTKTFGPGSVDKREHRRYREKVSRYYDESFSDGSVILRTMRGTDYFFVFRIYTTKSYDRDIAAMGKEPEPVWPADKPIFPFKSSTGRWPASALPY